MRRPVTFFVSRIIPLVLLSPAALFGQSSFLIITPGKTTPLRRVRAARFSRRRILLSTGLITPSALKTVPTEFSRPAAPVV
jgi:hypothetical protein